MSIEALVTSMSQLLKLHESLLVLSKSKTEMLKKGDVDSLQSIMAKEQKYTSAILTIEQGRQRAAQSFLQKSSEDLTLSHCIEAAIPEVSRQLQLLQEQLATVLNQLQMQNDLNKQLIYQSLQFVNMSLHMFQPQEESAIYGRPNQQRQRPRQSFFDSEA